MQQSPPVSSAPAVTLSARSMHSLLLVGDIDRLKRLPDIRRQVYYLLLDYGAISEDNHLVKY